MLNRSQALVPTFSVIAWASLPVILALEPEIYDQALRLPPGDRRLAELAFVCGLTGFIAFLGVGVLRRSLDVLARPGRLSVRNHSRTSFVPGARRHPACGRSNVVRTAAGRLWVAQFGIGLMMLAEYHQAWGAR
jgi:hypothetical protein